MKPQAAASSGFSRYLCGLSASAMRVNEILVQQAPQRKLTDPFPLLRVGCSHAKLVQNVLAVFLTVTDIHQVHTLAVEKHRIMQITRLSAVVGGAVLHQPSGRWLLRESSTICRSCDCNKLWNRELHYKLHLFISLLHRSVIYGKWIDWPIWT